MRSHSITATLTAIVLYSLAAPAEATVATDETCRLYSEDDVGSFVTCEDGRAPRVEVEPTVPANKRTALGLYLTASEAFSAKAARPERTLLLDIRTRAEVTYLGMPTVADAHVPYMEMSPFHAWDNGTASYKLDLEPKFLDRVQQLVVRRGMTRDDALILLCRSGQRSAAAADLLARAGFRRVYSVVDGYEGDTAVSGAQKGKRVVNGWRNAGLPWSYSLDKTKMALD